MLKGTKEDVAKRICEVSDKLREVADKILSEVYDPKDWVEINEMFAPVVSCLETQAVDFTRKRKIEE